MAPKAAYNNLASVSFLVTCYDGLTINMEPMRCHYPRHLVNGNIKNHMLQS